MKYHHILILGFFLSSFCSFSQPINNLTGDVALSPPNASSLGKYTDLPVDLSTGIPSIEIPIYSLVEGPLTLPVKLSYHASV